MFELEEDSGSTDIVVRKRDNIMTEVTLTVMIALDIVSPGLGITSPFNILPLSGYII